jgi:hypothetical protein
MEATTVSHQGGERKAEPVDGYLSMDLQSVCQRIQAMNKSDSGGNMDQFFLVSEKMRDWYDRHPFIIKYMEYPY